MIFKYHEYPKNQIIERAIFGVQYFFVRLYGIVISYNNSKIIYFMAVLYHTTMSTDEVDHLKSKVTKLKNNCN